MKTNFTRLVTLLMILFTATNNAFASIKIDGLFYNILSEEDRTVEVTSFDFQFYNYEGLIEIPKKILYQSKTYSVVKIGYRAFAEYSNVTSVIIPNSVTEIGEKAFYECGNLISVTMPNSIVKIGEDAFYYCKSLTSISMPSVKTIGSSAFRGCSNLTTVSMPSVTEIYSEAFAYCRSLTSVTIPESVAKIRFDTFKFCESLTSVTIPNSVTEIGPNAFYSCDKLTSVDLPSVITIRWNAFLGCVSITSVSMPSVVTIEKSAFSGCDMTSIKFPNSVTSIDSYAFSGCDKLNSVTFGESNTTIETYAFNGCDQLKNLSIGKSLISVEPFSLCPIENISIDSDNENYTVVDNIIYDKSVSKLLLFHKKFTSFTIPNSVTTIGNRAFNKCNSLKSITIPNSITSIGDYAFADCTALEKIYMQSETPFVCDPRFPDEVLLNSTLYVPLDTKSKYEKVDPWRNFWNIEEFVFSGIDEVQKDDFDAVKVVSGNGFIKIEGIGEEEHVSIIDIQGREVYTGNGQHHSVSNLSSGLYLLKIGNRVKKVIL